MLTLLKFFVLLAIFLWASNANAFTRLSLVSRNQAQVNHLIQFEVSMSTPTNEQSCEPIHKTTNDQKKSEPILSSSHIKRDKSTPTFKLVVASVSNINASSFNDKPSSKFQLVAAPVTNEFSKLIKEDNEQLAADPIIHWQCVNWLMAMPNKDWRCELPTSWKQCFHSTCGLLPR